MIRDDISRASTVSFNQGFCRENSQVLIPQHGNSMSFAASLFVVAITEDMFSHCMPLSHQHGGYTHPTPRGGIVLGLLFLVPIFLLVNIKSARAAFDGCTVLCGPIGHNIMY